MGIPAADSGYLGPFVLKEAFVAFSVNVISGGMTTLQTGPTDSRSRSQPYIWWIRFAVQLLFVIFYAHIEVAETPSNLGVFSAVIK